MHLVSGAKPAAALALGLCFAFAAAASAKASETNAPDLRIVDERVYGVLDGEPIEKVLDAFARSTGLVYEVAEPLRSETLSARFDGLPAGEALVDLLHRFDYTAVWRADGTIGRLNLTRLRAIYRDAAGGVALAVESQASREQAPKSGDEGATEFEDRDFWPEATSVAKLSRSELREAIQFMDLEDLASKVGMPVEQLYLAPYGEELEPTPDLNFILNLLQQLENHAEQGDLYEP